MADRATNLKASLLDDSASAINPATEEGQLAIIAAIEAGGSGADNFSYNVIATDITIPLYQQMGVWGGIDIQGTSELDIIGELILSI